MQSATWRLTVQALRPDQTGPGFQNTLLRRGGSLNRLGLKKYLAADENDLDGELVTVWGIPEEIVVQFL